jgi:hypothetical protein
MYCYDLLLMEQIDKVTYKIVRVRDFHVTPAPIHDDIYNKTYVQLITSESQLSYIKFLIYSCYKEICNKRPCARKYIIYIRDR